MNYIITDNLDDPRIICFLMTDDRASIYHHPAWIKAISETYNYPAYYLIIEDSNKKKILGLIPFVVKQVSRKIKKVVCLPSTTHCDPLFPSHFNMNNVIAELKNHFGETSEFDFKFKCNPGLKNFTTTLNYFYHIIELGSTIDETYNAFGKRSIKRFINKSDKNGLKLRFGNSETDVRIFYNIEKKLRQSIGLPPAPYNFFFTIWNSLKINDLILIPIIEYNNIPIASSLVLKFKDTFHFEYTAIDKKYIDLYPNHKLHWDIIKLAQTEYNAKYIDMGRTAVNQQSLIYFKEKWNAKGFPLYRLRHPGNNNEKLRNGKLYKAFKYINKQLPTKILELEGKLLYRYID